MGIKRRFASNITIRELGNGFMVEVYVYELKRRNDCGPCAPTSAMGYDLNTFVAKSFEEAQLIAAKVRLEKIDDLKEAA